MNCLEHPTLSDFTRLAAMAAALRPALKILVPKLSFDWMSVHDLSKSLNISEESTRLQCLALKTFGWVEFFEENVRRKASSDGVWRDEDAWLTIIDYYSDFAMRKFPLHMESRHKGHRDYYQMLISISRSTIEFLLGRFSKDSVKEILDFGCGLAPHTQAILGAAPRSRATLVDKTIVLADLRLEIAHNNLTDSVEFVSSESSASFGADRFDIILLLNVLHEMPASEQVSTIHELAHSLKPNGEIIIQLFCRDLAPDWHADALEIATLMRVGLKSDVLDRSSYLRYMEEAGLRVSEGPESLTPAGPSNILLIGRKSL